MKTQEEVTRIGNPRKPEGTEGEEMLERMNQSHYEVTGWALSYWEIQEDDRVLDIGCGRWSNASPDGGKGNLRSCDRCGLFGRIRGNFQEE